MVDRFSPSSRARPSLFDTAGIRAHARAPFCRFNIVEGHKPVILKVKPDNLLIELRTSTVRLADFGLARFGFFALADSRTLRSLAGYALDVSRCREEEETFRNSNFKGDIG